MLNINTSAFHDYDIRGVYPSDVNEEFYYHLGKALATYVKTGPIAAGHDTRLSSPSCFAKLVEGITDYGLDVVDLGMISTEMHNFASGKYGFPANIVVSASHNPPKYNGAKFLVKGVRALHGEFGLPEIKALVNEELPKAAKKGTVTKKDIFNDWIEHALSFVDYKNFKKLKVVVDAGNGMGGPSWQEMIKRLNSEIVPLYLDPDGNFPNHIADPIKDENTETLRQTVKDTKANLGIALDGDADRIFFVDETGRKISGTLTTAIITDHLMKKQKGVYMYNAICGRIVKEIIEQAGNKPMRTRVGHSFIKSQMQQYKGIFCGEHSGHFFYGANYGAESSLITGLLMIEILSQTGKKLSELADKFDKYVTSGEINFKVPDTHEMQKKIETRFAVGAESVDELDGVTAWFKDYWFNVRASKTEPLLRLNVEAKDTATLNKVKDEVIGFLLENGAVRK